MEVQIMLNPIKHLDDWGIKLGTGRITDSLHIDFSEG